MTFPSSPCAPFVAYFGTPCTQSTGLGPRGFRTDHFQRTTWLLVERQVLIETLLQVKAGEGDIPRSFTAGALKLCAGFQTTCAESNGF